MSDSGFMFELPDALLRGGRYLPLAHTIALPGGVITMKSSTRDASVLFDELASRREPFTMVLCRTPALKADGTLSLQTYGVLGMVTRHEVQADGEAVTEVLGIGRVKLGAPYLLVDEQLPRLDVTRREPTEAHQREALQQALVALVEEFCEPLRLQLPELTHMLTHFASAHEDTGLNIDRVAHALAEGDTELLQRFIDETSLIRRIHLLHDAMRLYVARRTTPAGARMDHVKD